MKRPRRQPREEPDGSFSGVHRRQTLKSAAWAFRVLFVLALVAAIWYTRPERNPPGTPIAGESGTTTTDRIELPTPEERAARDTDSDPFERDESVDASASP
ncbi:MAG: hypothetical protein JNG90_02180, partial [Planctomycetaceae bacterium]|nr:hypothetical protein [Planctomycetaceae bacterium]